MKIILCIIYFCALCNVYSYDYKSGSIDRILELLKELYVVAISDYEEKQAIHTQDLFRELPIYSKIKKLNPSELTRFALMCKSISYPQNAENVNFDCVYVQAFWASLKMLGEYKTREAYDGLCLIERSVQFDGGDKLIFDAILQRHKNDR